MRMIRTSGSRGGLILALAAAICMGGCRTRIADLTLVSTKNIDLSSTSLDIRTGQRVTGQDCVYSVFGLIPLGVPNLQEAVDDALEKVGGNIMVD